MEAQACGECIQSLPSNISLHRLFRELLMRVCKLYFEVHREVQEKESTIFYGVAKK